MFRMESRGVPETRCSKGVVRRIHKPMFHAIEPHTKEWIVSFETTLNWRTFTVAPSLRVILRTIQLYSLRHVDTNQIYNAHA